MFVGPNEETGQFMTQGVTLRRNPDGCRAEKYPAKPVGTTSDS